MGYLGGDEGHVSSGGWGSCPYETDTTEFFPSVYHLGGQSEKRASASQEEGSHQTDHTCTLNVDFQSLEL